MRTVTATSAAWGLVPKNLRQAVNRYAAAHVRDSWKGGGDPEDWPAIEEELKRSKQHLADVLLAALNVTQ